MLYADSDIIDSKKALNANMLIVYALLAAGVILCAIGLTVRNRALAIIGLIACCMLAYFWYDMKASVWRKYARFLADVASGRAHEATGVVSRIADAVRRSEEGVAIRDVTIDAPDGEHTLFYWDDAKPLPDMAGKNVCVTAYGRYITGVSVIEQ